ncbi:MAG: MFS transporter [Spirochaetota bacterium]|nr:MFS transporter [Spirochaetota bacterium]
MLKKIIKANFYGWINVSLLFVIYGTAMGIVFYGFTVIFPVMIKTQGWGRGDASLAHTIRGIIVGLLAPMVALTINRYGTRLTMSIGLGIMTVSMLLLGLFASQLWHWIFLWGIIMPFAFAFSGIIPIQTTIMFWFNVKRATVLGIVLTGAAVAGFIITPLLTWIMQMAGSWELGWLIIGIFSLIALIASYWIIGKPSDIGQHIDGINSDDNRTVTGSGVLKSAKTFRTSVSWTLKETLHTWALYLTMLVMLAQLWSLYIVTVHGVLHLTDVGFSALQASSIISIIILSSGVARFPMGIAGDRIEPHWILSAAMGIMALSLFGIWKAPLNISAMLVIGSIYGFAFGTTVVMLPAMIGNYFGPSSFASINGFIQPFLIGLGAPVPVLAGYIADKYGNYDLAFIGVLIMLLFGAVCASLASPPHKSDLEKAPHIVLKA